MRTARNSLGRVRIALDRPRLWRVTAGLAALLFCALLVGAAQGSIDVVAKRPAVIPGGGRAWERWCVGGSVRVDRVRLAFCARVNGIVLSSTRGPGPGEAHVAVVGGFHLTVVKLPTYASVPKVGSRVVAVGPLFRARNGQREVQAFRLLGS
jgi:hypothetical protein